MVRRGHARTFSGQALLAFGKPHLISELRCPDLLDFVGGSDIML